MIGLWNLFEIEQGHFIGLKDLEYFLCDNHYQWIASIDDYMNRSQYSVPHPTEEEALLVITCLSAHHICYKMGNHQELSR